MATKRFIVSGTINVKGRPVYSKADGGIVGFRQKDGSVVKLSLALEVQNKEGTKFNYLTTDDQMEKVGFTVVLYDRADFGNQIIE